MNDMATGPPDHQAAYLFLETHLGWRFIEALVSKFQGCSNMEKKTCSGVRVDFGPPDSRHGNFTV
jgi:hypothetical protein